MAGNRFAELFVGGWEKKVGITTSPTERSEGEKGSRSKKNWENLRGEGYPWEGVHEGERSSAAGGADLSV